MVCLLYLTTLNEVHFLDVSNIVDSFYFMHNGIPYNCEPVATWAEDKFAPDDMQAF